MGDGLPGGAGGGQDKNRAEVGAGHDATKGARASAQVAGGKELGVVKERLRVEYLVSTADGATRRSAQMEELVKTAGAVLRDSGCDAAKSPYAVKVRESDANAAGRGPAAMKAIGMVA